MSADVIVHPHSGVNLEPAPPTEASIRSAIEASNAERRRITALTGLPLPLHELPKTYDEEMAQLEALETLRVIADRYGYKRVAVWVKNLAHIHGETL